MAPSIWTDSLATHKQRLRQHIVRTAAELLAERGLGDVSMSLLAQRAGIARATLYNHFPDFERVLAALVADQVARFRVQLDRHLAAAADPAERLRRYLVAVHDWATRQRQQPSKRNDTARPTSRTRTLSPQVVTATHEPLSQLHEILEQILTDAIASHAIHPDTDPRLHADLILKLLLDPRQPATAGCTPGAERDQLVRFVLRGLVAHPPSPAAGHVGP